MSITATVVHEGANFGFIELFSNIHPDYKVVEFQANIVAGYLNRDKSAINMGRNSQYSQRVDPWPELS